jgi:hypothetical protein
MKLRLPDWGFDPHLPLFVIGSTKSLVQKTLESSPQPAKQGSPTAGWHSWFLRCDI